MIVRVVTATVPLSVAGRFHELLRGQLRELHAHEGLRYVKLARRLLEADEEVVLIEEWIDAPSMYVWAGPDIRRARLPGDADRLLTEVSVQHYEALDLDPDLVWPVFGTRDEGALDDGRTIRPPAGRDAASPRRPGPGEEGSID